jgi:hypothetical protein
MLYKNEDLSTQGTVPTTHIFNRRINYNNNKHIDTTICTRGFKHDKASANDNVSDNANDCKSISDNASNTASNSHSYSNIISDNTSNWAIVSANASDRALTSAYVNDFTNAFISTSN